MKRILMTMVCVAALAACAAEPGFTSLFDGKTLEGDKRGQVCIASMGKCEKSFSEAFVSINADSADVFGRASGVQGSELP